jgi:hypothetical protein
VFDANFFRNAPLILFFHQLFPCKLGDLVRASVPGDVPRRALAILNPPQAEFALEVGIIKVNQGKLSLTFIPASKKMDSSSLN